MRLNRPLSARVKRQRQRIGTGVNFALGKQALSG
jgi:hypothetical protein